MYMFKRKYPRTKLIDGKRQKLLGNDGHPIIIESSAYTIEFKDVDGKTRRVRGFRDKVATRHRMAELQRNLEHRKAGITTISTDHLDQPIRDHITDFIQDLKRSRRSQGYIGKVESRLGRLANDLRLTNLGSITPDGLSSWLARSNEIGDRTKNHYLDAANVFCRWCVAHHRLERNPLIGVARIENPEPTYERRAVTIEQLRDFLASVPTTRQLPYLFAVLTGLRRKEMRLLEWGDVHLDTNAPYIALRGPTTKSKRSDVLPVPPELADALRAFRPVSWARAIVHKWVAWVG